MEDNVKKYNGIDGLRTIAAIGIIIMHVAANTEYTIKSYAYTKIIPMFGLFTFLFMVISAFCLCCGYYDKIKNNKITLNDFYKKRYSRIVPFFAIIVLLEVVYQHSIGSIYEGFLDLTLSFSFLPNPEITIIGVGWTLGVIFAFYMLFPFFVFLFDNKKRGITVTIISILITLSCMNYFFTSQFVTENFTANHNFLYCFMFFAGGGLLYLFKDKFNNVKKALRIPMLILCIALTIIFAIYISNIEEYKIICLLPLFLSYLVYAISFDSKILSNKITAFISKYSLELYLCHMMVFRIIEKAGILYLFGKGMLSYVVCSIITFAGSLCISILFKYIYDKIVAMKKK